MSARGHIDLIRGITAAKKNASYQLTYSVSSTVTSSVGNQALAVILTSTTDCYVDFNTAAATATAHFLPAYQPQSWEVKGGKDTINVIEAATQGTLNITEISKPRGIHAD